MGLTGDVGLTGATGEIGVVGLMGNTGHTGPIGHMGATNSVKGQMGEVGATGQQGDDGATGPQGGQGEIGAKGPQGLGGGNDTFIMYGPYRYWESSDDGETTAVDAVYYVFSICVSKVRFFPQQINLPLISSGIKTDDLIDELPVEKRHLNKLIIICRI